MVINSKEFYCEGDYYRDIYSMSNNFHVYLKPYFYIYDMSNVFDLFRTVKSRTGISFMAVLESSQSWSKGTPLNDYDWIDAEIDKMEANSSETLNGIPRNNLQVTLSKEWTKMIDEFGNLIEDAKFKIVCRAYKLSDILIRYKGKSAIISLKKYKVFCKDLILFEEENVLVIIGKNSIYLMNIISSNTSLLQYTIRKMTENDAENPYKSLVSEEKSFRVRRMDRDNILIYFVHEKRETYIFVSFTKCYPRIKASGLTKGNKFIEISI
jgi:hypothetical protein